VIICRKLSSASPICRLVYSYYPFKDKAQTALFKDPVRTAQ